MGLRKAAKLSTTAKLNGTELLSYTSSSRRAATSLLRKLRPKMTARSAPKVAMCTKPRPSHISVY